MLVRIFLDFIRLCASGFNEFLDKNGPYMSASISFYTLFSMFPLLLALLSIFGFLLHSETLQEKLIKEKKNSEKTLQKLLQHIISLTLHKLL